VELDLDFPCTVFSTRQHLPDLSQHNYAKMLLVSVCGIVKKEIIVELDQLVLQ